MKGIFIISSILMLVACASTSPTEQPAKLQFIKGSVTLPQAEDWRFGEYPGKQTPGQYAVRGLSPTYSIAARLEYRAKFSYLDAFDNMSRPREMINKRLEEIHKSYSVGRFKLISFDSSQKTLTNAECIEFRVDATDYEVPGYKDQAHPLRAIGLSCIFTDSPLYLLIGYSERRAASERSLATFDVEAAKFLDGLVVDSTTARGDATVVVNSAAVVRNLERYAALLREMGSNTWPSADAINEGAKKLRESLRADVSGSVYIGFDPAEILQSYADLLSGRGQMAEAKEMEALAKWYTDCNLARFKGMQC